MATTSEHSVDYSRRHEDRDRMLNQRLDQLERESRDLSVKVTSIEGSMRTVTLEQSHLKELLTARLLLIERTQEIGNGKIDTLSQNITLMASDVDKSPMGRSLRDGNRVLEANMSEQNDKMEALERDLRERKLWQDRVDTVIGILKWIGAGGLVALLLALLQVFGIIK